MGCHHSTVQEVLRVAALEAEKWLAKEAKERQREAAVATNMKLGRKCDETVSQKIEQASSLEENRETVSQKIEQRRNKSDGEAAEQAAKLFGTNGQT